jgi:hypothetical protein
MSTDTSNLLSRLAALEAEVSRVRDERAIEAVLARYSRALDWLDDDQLRAVFFDDATIDYGFFRGTGAQFRPVLMEVERTAGRRWHFTAQVKIALSGDTAEVESYNFSVASSSAAPMAGGTLAHFYGYYKDRFERRGGAWGIASRKHLLIGIANLPEAALEGPMAALNAIGPTSPQHPDYRRL